MFERLYRQRLDADLARWEGAGLVSPSAAAAIRGALPPLSPAVTIATAVAIVGGLLIAAAFLAFVASIAVNWVAIARPMRFAILAAGMIGAYGMGAVFARGNKNILADISVSVGSIVFGAAIALVGQMYHLASDFAAGMMLWSLGALVAAVMTGSRGALAVALTVGCIWSFMRVMETNIIDTYQAPHLPFVALSLIAAGLAVAWNSVAARHLVAVVAFLWLGLMKFVGYLGVVAYIVSVGGIRFGFIPNPGVGTLAAGASLLLGAGLALAALRKESLRMFGLTLSTYGAFGLAIFCGLGLLISDLIVARRYEFSGTMFSAEFWALICGVIGVVLALTTAAMTKRAGPAFAALASGLVLVLGAGKWLWPASDGEPWLAYALLLAAMLCLVISGMLDEVRPRVVAGWLGLALVVAGIALATQGLFRDGVFLGGWAAQESLFRRAVFFGIAGMATVGLAIALGRMKRKRQPA